MKRFAIAIGFLLCLAAIASAQTTTVTVSPSTLAFGNETTGVTSTVSTITITNTGSATYIPSSSPTISGTNASDFSVSSSSTCQNGVGTPVNASCTILITFTPSAVGSRSATVSISDNATGSPHTAALTGTGIAPTSNPITINCPTSSNCKLVGQITMTVANNSPPPVSNPPTVTISPNTANLSTSGTKTYTASITNDPNNLGVTWSVVCLAGPGLCGSVSPTTSKNNVAVTYTAPASAPTPNSVTITATSVLNPQVSSSATADIIVTPPPPSTTVVPCGPNFVMAGSANVFNCPASQGSAPVIAIMGGPSNVISSVTASNGTNTYTLTAACPPSGSCYSNVGGGLATIYYGLGLPSGLTKYTVNLSASGNDLQVVLYDTQNITAFDNAVAGGGSSCTVTQAQSITTQSAGLIVSANATLAVTAINAPFNFVTALNGNVVGGTGYTVTSGAGTYTPTWTEAAAGCALYTAAFIGGAVTPTVSVAIAPTSFSVTQSTSKNFTPTVTNGSQGVNWTLTQSGSPCSPTCGTLNVSTTASGVPVNYTAPASVPSPATVTLTATSIDDATKSAAATITVTAAPVVGVTVSPTTANCVANGSQTFTATVANGTLNTVNWTTSGGGCTGTGCGVVSPTTSASGAAVTYTAPSTVPSPATVSLTATSTDDGTKSASATITITSPVITVSVSPTGPVTLNAGGSTASFSYNVVNDTAGATWSLTCSATCGTLSSTTASTTTYTSPATNNPLTVTLTAASVTTPSIKSSVTINVNPVQTSTSCGSNCPAFLAPSGQSANLAAQGGGAVTAGGRGGKVYEVTQTADSNGACTATSVGYTNCSYRQAYNDTQGAGCRYVVFRVAGIFPVTNGDMRTGVPCMTVLGQTAPGEVILGGPSTTGALGGISTHDVILRYLTMSPDNPNINTGPDTGTTSIWIVNCSAFKQAIATATPPPTNTGCYNIMIDHLTLRWSGNKSWITTSNFTPTPSVAGVGPNHSITTQWTLMYEPAQGHPVGYGTATDESCTSTLAAGNCLFAYETDIDFHHDMLLNIGHRIPENGNRSTRWVNNIIYNWGDYANEFLGAMTVDTINNKYITGQLNSVGGAQTYPIHFTSNSQEMSGNPSVYVAGNIGGPAGTNTVASNQYGSLVNEITGENGNEIGPIPSGWERSSPMAASNSFPIVPDPATQLDTILTPQIGNSQHLDQNGNWVNHRSNTDTVRINQYLNGGSGGFWPNGVTYSGVFYTQSSTAPGLPASCPSGNVCQAFPALQSNYQDIAPASGTPCTSTLHDGICDAWKTRYFPSGVTPEGVSTSSPNFYKTTNQTNGIPYIEVFADGRVP